MKFLFNLFNHNETGKRSLEDVIGILGHQMRTLGHDVVWDPKKESAFYTREAGINIVVEGFSDWSVACLKEAHGNGARIVILATEEPGEKGFNQGTQAEMIKRQRIFHEAAKFCEGIIHLVPGDHVTRWYSQFAPAAYTELGYAPSLVRKSVDIEPDFDFGFYGSISPRRLRLLKRLANRTRSVKAVKIVSDFTEQGARDQAMRRAKVIVQIRKFESMGLVSSSRCNTALCIGRPIVAEPHLLSKPWDEVVPFAQTEEGFLNLAMMTRATWRGAHATQFEKFKARFPPDVCIGKALDQIGILKERAAA